MPSSILIIGGGFGGIQAALSLARKKIPAAGIRLIDPKSYFEYHAALYRFATGSSPMEACIPYRDIFEGSGIDVVEDSAAKIDLTEKVVTGASGSHYHFDTLILALGSVTTTFGIEGIEQHSYGMKSATEAIRLKLHIESAFNEATLADIERKKTLLHLVVVGGGATGVELAGELASYTRMLALRHRLDLSLVQIDLIEATERILGNLPPRVSALVEKRLRSLGVNVITGKSLMKEDAAGIALKDGNVKTSTVVWTAGVRANPLLQNTIGLTVDRKGRVEVDEKLQAKGQRNVFILGDAAVTKFSGMAQTAIGDGRFVADVIEAGILKSDMPAYRQVPPFYSVPVGRKWAMWCRGDTVIAGYAGWILRRLADFRVYRNFLPFWKAVRALRCGCAKD